MYMRVNAHAISRVCLHVAVHICCAYGNCVCVCVRVSVRVCSCVRAHNAYVRMYVRA